MRTKVLIIFFLALALLPAGASAADRQTPKDCRAIPEVMPDRDRPARKGVNEGTKPRKQLKPSAYRPSPEKVCPTDSAVAGVSPEDSRDPSEPPPRG